MDDRDYKLILLVQQHQHIYDKNSYYFKDKNAVEASWKLIAASLNTTEDDCQRRWCVLRNRYAKYRREEGKPEARRKPWPLVDALTFLEAHVKRRRSYRTVSDLQGYGEQHILPDNPILAKPEKWEEIIIDEDDDEDLEQDVKNFHSDSNASSEDNPIKNVPKCLEVQPIPKIISSTTLENNLKDIEIIRIHDEKRTESTVNVVDDKNILASAIDDKTQVNGIGTSGQINIATPDDALLHFCLSLHQSMKSLPKKYMTKAKIEILQVIDKYENDD